MEKGCARMSGNFGPFEPRIRVKDTSLEPHQWRFGTNGVWVTDNTAQFVTGQEFHDKKNLWLEHVAHNKRYAGNLPGKGKPFPSNADIGGALWSMKTEYEESLPHVSYYSTNWPASVSYAVDGKFYPLATFVNENSSVWTVPTSYRPANPSTLRGLGSTAISRCAPTNPHAQVAVGIAELIREGFPSAPALSTLKHRRPEDDYLNYQFGIAPLVGDLKDAHSAWKTRRNALEQYYRDSGRTVRRGYSYPEESDSTVTVKTGAVAGPRNSPPSTVWQDSSLFRTITTTTVSRETWFSGGFTYHAQRPTGQLADMDRVIQEMNHLYGVEITPSVLWNLTPWSWLADWNTNIGDVLNNVSMIQTDGMFMRYGYVMQKVVFETDCVSSGYILKNGVDASGTQRFRVTYLQRQRATPFGFGLDPGSFTARQWAILAAIGVSRGRGDIIGYH